jgi:ribosomal peptide maturation radical SAM protein 1
VAQAQGHTARVLYANLSFARLIGPQLYRRLCHTPTQDLTGERLFRLAWPGAAWAGPGPIPDQWAAIKGTVPPFRHLQDQALLWAEQMAQALAALPAPVIGLSSSFQQTLPSLALITRLKAHAPDKITLIGGANAEDVMGAALADLAPQIDHVFQGEAEASFAAFLRGRAAGHTLPRLIAGQINDRLDEIPLPDYSDYFTQWAALADIAHVPEGLYARDRRLPYESSRGCWWGAKHHCTFCGLNANGMTHRIKSADKVAADLTSLVNRHGISRILMVDNIMPHSYVSTLLPRLAAAEETFQIFYEQKANLGRHRMQLLKAAGVTTIQPGIETLSTALAQRMNKGTSLRVNLDCLRQARAAGVSVAWNLLSDFPGDQADDYEDMLKVIPLIPHLEPPGGLGHLRIDRFSPYHMTPDAYGIQDLRPLPAYGEVFPGQDTTHLAYHFEGTYPSALRRDPGLKDRMRRAMDTWQAAWDQGPPLMVCVDLEGEGYLLLDTRSPVPSQEARLVSEEEARLITCGASEGSPLVFDLVDRGQLIAAEGRFLALACVALDSALWERTVSEAEGSIASGKERSAP